MASATTSQAAQQRRRAIALLCVLVAGTVASLAFTVQPFWDARPDAARYLLAARSLAEGDGYTVMGEPFRLRPPGFSALLAPLVAWRGFDFPALNLFVSLFGVLAVVLLYLLLLPRVGALVGCAVAILVWLNPQLQALCNQVLSDVPALALALLVLLALRWSNERPSLGRDLVLAVILAAAVYVRSANLLLIPALVLDRACRWTLPGAPSVAAGAFLLHRLIVPLGVLALLYLPWLLTPSFSSQYDSPDLHSYGTAFLRSDPNDPGAAALGAAQWTTRIADNAAAYSAIFGSGMVTRRMSAAAPVVAVLGALALLAVLARRREAPEWFAIGTAVVLIGYYVAAARLLLPVFVLTVAALAEGASWLLGRVLGQRIVERTVAACLLVAAALTLGAGSGQRFEVRAQAASLVAATDHMRQTLPADAALGGDVGAVYALLLDRPVYSLRPLSRRGKDDAIAALVDERRLAAVVARRDGPLDAIVARLRESGAEVVTFPHHVVVRLAPRG